MFPENQRLKGYITNRLPNISRFIATNWPWFNFMLYAMLNFDDVYIHMYICWG